MTLITVTESSNVYAIGYDLETRTFGIQFKYHGDQLSDIYLFHDVPHSHFSGITMAPSKGKYFREHIKDKYPMTKEAKQS